MKQTAKPASETKMVLKESSTRMETSRPDFVKSGTARGMEQVKQEDISVPRLTICQTLSPQRKKDSQQYIAGLDEGDLFNSITKKVYGRELTVIPLFFFKNRIKFNVPIGNGIDCMSINGIDGGRLSATCAACEFSRFNGSEHPQCTGISNFAVILPPNELAVISLKSTGIKIAKSWNALMRVKGCDMFAAKYKAEVVPETRNSLSFYQWKITDAGWVSKEEFVAAEQIYTALRGKTIAVDDIAVQDGDSENDAPPF